MKPNYMRVFIKVMEYAQNGNMLDFKIFLHQIKLVI